MAARVSLKVLNVAREALWLPQGEGLECGA